MNEHTRCGCPPVLTRAAELCPACRAEWESWLGEIASAAEPALEIVFALALRKVAA